MKYIRWVMKRFSIIFCVGFLGMMAYMLTQIEYKGDSPWGPWEAFKFWLSMWVVPMWMAWSAREEWEDYKVRKLLNEHMQITTDLLTALTKADDGSNQQPKQ